MGSRRDFGGIEVGLTNLDKVLYPATGTTKGQVIDYFTAIAPALLPHIALRPVTRKRWPNGVEAGSFFEKNLAEHVPKWLARRTVEHSDRPVVYPLIDSVAGMAWLGQQAALELHVPQWRFDGAERGPITRLVFDLDPGPGAGLSQCAEVALILHDVVREVGLDAYPVTSGSKGIHVYVPLDRKIGPTGASAIAKQVATNLQQLRPKLVTANMAKSEREGKVLLDWSQNNMAKTTIAPYSLRGRAEPWVAAPRSWEEIENRKKLRHLRFEEVLKRWRRDGDLLAGLDEPAPEPSAEPDRLRTYRSKRDAERTPEPVPAAAPAPSTGNRYVIQQHRARRLHWDVRLEREGVLVSWAVPKGPPVDTHENRLAVHTEDHPLEYLDFHGAIPRGEYGAGEMTIWDSGTYETEKWRADEVIVRLRGERLDGRYALIQTNGNQWLMHLMKDPAGAAGAGVESAGAQRVSTPREPVPLPHGITPMLATQGDVATLDAEHWVFETKWDGFRLLAEIDDGTVVLRSRTGHVVTQRYPGLAVLADELSGHRVLLDGEAVVFDDRGIANLGLLRSDPGRAVFVAFDVLHMDGTSLLRKRYADRRLVLEALAKQVPSLLVPPPLDGPGARALRASRDQGMEGVVAKRRDSVYLPGKRGHSWIKTRNWRTLPVVIGGFRRSENRQFASLLVGVWHEGELHYLGRVGTGFGERELSELSTQLNRLERKTSPFVNELSAEERKEAAWVTPKLTGTVRFMNWTEAGRLWHPAWIPASE
ncbi:ATP-dependent DNA ligase [Nocardia acidivorans]|uniref:ATP-dependent DNA ligase n=1 Tax=Nocardia acidivorans TaxID=404580 RepID=UPI00082F808D|nr:ATP-dependent DNA ligase [Nocardia acidivorans]